MQTTSFSVAFYTAVLDARKPLSSFRFLEASASIASNWTRIASHKQWSTSSVRSSPGSPATPTCLRVRAFDHYPRRAEPACVVSAETLRAIGGKLLGGWREGERILLLYSYTGVFALKNVDFWNVSIVGVTSERVFAIDHGTSSFVWRNSIKGHTLVPGGLFGPDSIVVSLADGSLSTFKVFHGGAAKELCALIQQPVAAKSNDAGDGKKETVENKKNGLGSDATTAKSNDAPKSDGIKETVESKKGGPGSHAKTRKSTAVCHIYVLKCKENKRYVGKVRVVEGEAAADTVARRFAKHLSGGGAAFTAKFEPVCVEEIIERQSAFDHYPRRAEPACVVLRGCDGPRADERTGTSAAGASRRSHSARGRLRPPGR
ncbi:MAG: hypothetical protein KGL39_01120 [Patescibacteria group bacterium]|nr:hypothetical protein [Patescibacteria group bacterium]